MHPETALITGASSGIGLHLAREFAAHRHRVVLVAPDAGELVGIADAIEREFDVSAIAIPCDLEREDAADLIARQLDQQACEVDILVNNAGHGQKGRFWELPVERHLSVLRLNVEAVLRMTARLLPPMLLRRRGRIMNTASVAGFEPGPLLAVYHASKAFVLSFSEALALELDGSGVSVTALCPGPTDTDFFIKADMLGTRAFQQAQLMAPQEVARAGYEALMAGDRIVVPGAANKALVFARRFLPEMAQARMHEKLYEELPVDKRGRTRGDVEGRARPH
jgi:uncharacterized protein